MNQIPRPFRQRALRAFQWPVIIWRVHSVPDMTWREAFRVTHWMIWYG